MKSKIFKIRSISTTEGQIRKQKEQAGEKRQTQNLQEIPEVSTSKQYNDLAKMFKSFMSQSMKMNSNHQSCLQARDIQILVELPQIQNGKIQSSQLKVWMAKVIKTISSSAFKNYSKNEMNFEQTKIYCSENIFKNIVNLSQSYSINEKQFEMIDNHIKKGVLSYLATKYPLTESTQINKKLEEVIHEINNIQSLTNNYFNTAKIEFQYRQDGNYNDLIMRMINDLMEIVDGQAEEEKTNYFDFEQFMSSIFEKVQDEDWVRKQDKDALFSHLKLAHQRSSINMQQINATNKEQIQDLKQKIRKRNEEKQKYKNKVKQYTHYLIGRKIPENAPSYTEKQIQNGNMALKSPTILRILTKWCGQLWQKYNNSYFSNRSESVKLQKCGNINSLLPWMRKDIDQRLSIQRQEILKFKSGLSKNNYEMQTHMLLRQIQNKGDQFIDHIEKICGKFSYKIVKNLHSYIIAYLNRLIHGLMKMSKKFFDQSKLSAFSNWPYPPNLLSFKIGDLMRCKCSSKQKEILKIYKEIQRISKENPQKLKIVRIKNRLRSGTNDILMNIRFNNVLLCQIQLAIKSKTSDFIKCSNMFHHYLYELQRSQFGPLTQLCSIWMSLDRRAAIYRQLVQEQQFKLKNIQHSCSKMKKKYEMVVYEKPFICSQCNCTIFHNNYLRNHSKCNLCQYMLCAKCEIQQENQNILKQTLIVDKQLRSNFSSIVTKPSQIPNFGACIFIESKLPKIQMFTQVTYMNKVYILGKQNNQIYEVQKAQKEWKKYFKNKNIIFEIKDNDKFKPVETDQAIKLYILPSIMKKNFIMERQTISLMDLNLSTNECRQILSVGTKSQKQNVKNLFLVDNQIDQIPFNPEQFPNLRWITLSRNKIQNFEGFEQLTKLSNVIIIENQLKQIPPQLYKCTSLQEISLSDNFITAISEEISNLKQIKKLELENNLIASLPQALCQCTQALKFTFTQNQLTQLPKNIIQLKKMTTLLLNQNLFTSLPEDLGALQNLIELNLSSNPSLTSLPLTLQKLKKLQIFDISETSINEFPSFLPQLLNLKSLNISKSNILSIPEGIKSLKKLQILNINDIYGIQLTESIGELKYLKQLNISNCGLSVLPSCLKNLVNIEKLNISGNYLTMIDNEMIGSFQKLVNLNISSCCLQTFPNIQNLSKLKTLELSENSIGIIKEQSLGELSQLEEFIALNCNLVYLPFSLTKCHKLVKLDVKNNQMTSLIDQAFKEQIENTEKPIWPNLNYAYLNVNKFTEIPLILCKCSNVLDLFMSDNELTSIRPEIRHMASLLQIEMNTNKIAALPHELVELPNLKGIYLSINQITEIPAFIKDIPRLQVFYVDSMDFTSIQCIEWILTTDIQVGSLKYTAETFKNRDNGQVYDENNSQEQNKEGDGLQGDQNGGQNANEQEISPESNMYEGANDQGEQQIEAQNIIGEQEQQQETLQKRT